MSATSTEFVVATTERGADVTCLCVLCSEAINNAVSQSSVRFTRDCDHCTLSKYWSRVVRTQITCHSLLEYKVSPVSALSHLCFVSVVFTDPSLMCFVPPVRMPRPSPLTLPVAMTPSSEVTWSRTCAVPQLCPSTERKESMMPTSYDSHSDLTICQPVAPDSFSTKPFSEPHLEISSLTGTLCTESNIEERTVSLASYDVPPFSATTVSSTTPMLSVLDPSPLPRVSCHSPLTGEHEEEPPLSTMSTSFQSLRHQQRLRSQLQLLVNGHLSSVNKDWYRKGSVRDHRLCGRRNSPFRCAFLG